jgi:hypothetical protein
VGPRLAGPQEDRKERDERTFDTERRNCGIGGSSVRSKRVMLSLGRMGQVAVSIDSPCARTFSLCPRLSAGLVPRLVERSLRRFSPFQASWSMAHAYLDSSSSDHPFLFCVKTHPNQPASGFAVDLVLSLAVPQPQSYVS